MLPLTRKFSYLATPFLVALLLLLLGGNRVSAAEPNSSSSMRDEFAMFSSRQSGSDPALDATGKIVIGRVQTNLHSPVAQALVTARRPGHDGRVQALSNAEGVYRMKLAPGKWALTVSPTDQSEPANWIYPHRPQLVKFRRHDHPELRRVNFTVLTVDASVSGKVTLPDGSVPPFPVTLRFHHARGFNINVPVGQDSGEFSTRLPHGIYRISVHPHSDRFVGPRLEPIELHPGQSLELGTIVLIAVNDHRW